LIRIIFQKDFSELLSKKFPNQKLRQITKRIINLIGLVIGFILTLSNYCFTVALLVFFISSSKATKFGSRQKRQLEEDFREGGQRNWVQVICNGGVAAQLALFYLMENGCGEIPINFISDYNISWFAISVMGSIACANGDTWASELGSVLSKDNPILITTLRRVPKGTNGGVSVIGLIVSALGGTVVGLGFMLMVMISANAKAYSLSPPQWPIVVIGLLAGLFGSVIDSVLGATLQYSGLDKKTNRVVESPGLYVRHISGYRLLDNHSVNLLSTFITSIISPYVAISLWSMI